jgi:hypothetical protein
LLVVCFLTGYALSACYSLVLLLRAAASSFLMSSSVNSGRSTLIVILLNVPVNGNGHLYY